MCRTIVTPPVVLAVAGSDSSGGAGIQADIKSISANGCFAATAITAITAQNTMGVRAIEPLSPAMVRAQMEAVFEGDTVQAVKVGMVYDEAIVHAIVEVIAAYRPPYVVCDPVMVATSGARLIAQPAIDALCDELFPISTIITPNLHEASLLMGKTLVTVDDMYWAAERLSHEYGCATLIKGGHLDGDNICDVLCADDEVCVLPSKKIDTPNLHGTGCTLSSAIAAHLAQGKALSEAVIAARDYVNRIIRTSRTMTLGRHNGALWHF